MSDEENEVESPKVEEAAGSAKLNDDSSHRALFVILALITVVVLGSIGYYISGVTSTISVTAEGVLVEEVVHPPIFEIPDADVDIALSVVGTPAIPETAALPAGDNYHCLIMVPAWTEEVGRQAVKLDCDVHIMPSLDPAYCARHVGGCIYGYFLEE